MSPVVLEGDVEERLARDPSRLPHRREDPYRLHAGAVDHQGERESRGSLPLCGELRPAGAHPRLPQSIT